MATKQKEASLLMYTSGGVALASDCEKNIIAFRFDKIKGFNGQELNLKEDQKIDLMLDEKTNELISVILK